MQKYLLIMLHDSFCILKKRFCLIAEVKMDLLLCAVMNDYNKNEDWYERFRSKERTILSIFKKFVKIDKRNKQKAQSPALNKTLCKKPI